MTPKEIAFGAFKEATTRFDNAAMVTDARSMEDHFNDFWNSTTPDPMPRDFGSVLTSINNGYKLARDGWNGKGMYVTLYTPEISKTRPEILPYLELKTAEGNFIPWLPGWSDIRAEDWTVVE